MPEEQLWDTRSQESILQDEHRSITRVSCQYCLSFNRRVYVLNFPGLHVCSPVLDRLTPSPSTSTHTGACTSCEAHGDPDPPRWRDVIAREQKSFPDFWQWYIDVRDVAIAIRRNNCIWFLGMRIRDVVWMLQFLCCRRICLTLLLFLILLLLAVGFTCVVLEDTGSSNSRSICATDSCNAPVLWQKLNHNVRFMQVVSANSSDGSLWSSKSTIRELQLADASKNHQNALITWRIQNA
jgi:hypothetical protein